MQIESRVRKGERRHWALEIEDWKLETDASGKRSAFSDEA
jgi:hypothetical protein